MYRTNDKQLTQSQDTSNSNQKCGDFGVQAIAGVGFEQQENIAIRWTQSR